MLKKLRIQNFRSYADDTFEFSPGINIIVGSNGSGKTNLLEAVLMITGTKSFRVKEIDTIMYEKSWCRIDSIDNRGARTLKLVRKDHQTTEKVFEINNQPIGRLTQNKKIPVVLFEPNHLLLFHDGPEARRDYLDDLLEYLLPSYQTTRKQYRRTLNQRNRLLKNNPINIKQQIFAWNIRLSDLGEKIAKYRRQLVEEITAKLPEMYKSLSDTTHQASLSYQTQFGLDQYSSQMLHNLEIKLEKDIQRGFTTVGPHRDDLVATIEGKEVSQNASRGEIRTLLLALKMLELKLSESAYNIKPILLLDDVFSELDGSRRKALLETVKGYQTFITTTDADIVPHRFASKCTIIPTRVG